ncbi:MAG TPA: lysylphosphatidylglycerol synthase domain-containing protein, partial [Xanthomonadaceae bacterium]|nr:lysylphosphatidylglycerol synthase domain-containing protein [Xanthomonadaceae bacterium]
GGWQSALRIVGVKIPFRTACSGVMASQIGKYLPGNVGHYFFRHIAVRRSAPHVAHTSLIGGVGAETVLLFAACIALAAPLASTPSSIVRTFPAPTSAGSAVVLLLLLLVAVRLLRRWKWLPPEQRAGQDVVWITCGLVCYLAFLFAASLMLGALLPGGTDPGRALAWLATAWVAGYIVPGAPGGLGVREAVLGAGLAQDIPAADAYAAVLMLRVVTLAGDGIMSAIGSAIGGLRFANDGRRYD